MINIEKKIDYKFKNKKLISLALTHSSYTNEINEEKFKSNERLEFLGDATLELIISEYLYKNYPSLPEGELTKMRANIVCTDSLTENAKALNIGENIVMGKGELISGGKNRKSILANTMESIIGAIYLDAGFKEAEKFVINKFANTIDRVVQGKMNRDYKTVLQEKIQKRKNQILQYRLIDAEGPDHSKRFYVEALLNNKVVGLGKGLNKKEAEQEAAKEALNNLHI